MNVYRTQWMVNNVCDENRISSQWKWKKHINVFMHTSPKITAFLLVFVYFCIYISVCQNETKWTVRTVKPCAKCGCVKFISHTRISFVLFTMWGIKIHHREEADVYHLLTAMLHNCSKQDIRVTQENINNIVQTHTIRVWALERIWRNECTRWVIIWCFILYTTVIIVNVKVFPERK